MDPNLSALDAEAQKIRMEFLKTDLALCLAFVDIAYTELEMTSNRDASVRAIGKAEEGHAAILRLLLDVDDGPETDAIEQQVAELRERLDRFSEKPPTI